MDGDFPPENQQNQKKNNNLAFVNIIEVPKEVGTTIAVSFPPFHSQ